MARRLPARADGRDLVLVVSVLPLLLGLGLVGAGLAGAEPSPAVVGTSLPPPASAALPSTATSPLVVTDRVNSTTSCQPGHPLTSHPGSVDPAPRQDDPREYLSGMAALLSRRRLVKPTALDPSHAFLDPGAHVGYFTILATPLVQNRNRSPVLHHPCALSSVEQRMIPPGVCPVVSTPPADQDSTTTSPQIAPNDAATRVAACSPHLDPDYDLRLVLAAMRRCSGDARWGSISLPPFTPQISRMSRRPC